MESNSVVNLLSWKDSYNILNRAVAFLKSLPTIIFLLGMYLLENGRNPSYLDFLFVRILELHLLYLDINQLSILKYLYWLRSNSRSCGLYIVSSPTVLGEPLSGGFQSCCPVFSVCRHVCLLDCKAFWGKRWNLVSLLSTPRHRTLQIKGAHRLGGEFNLTLEIM